MSALLMMKETKFGLQISRAFGWVYIYSGGLGRTSYLLSEEQLAGAGDAGVLSE